MDSTIDCPLCRESGGRVVWQDDDWRVVRVDDAEFPAYYRVIAQRHVAELSQLEPAQRWRCMELVCSVERTLIEQLAPTKINLAALGNMVPHLHWHVIARFDWDSHFPQAVWGARQRDVMPAAAQRLATILGPLDAAVAAALEQTAAADKTS
jgi:diadenosine tetraphosphate (Ap4A) HIT family hydrolase